LRTTTIAKRFKTAADSAQRLQRGNMDTASRCSGFSKKSPKYRVKNFFKERKINYAE